MLNIAIVGYGIAGVAAAILLRRAGHTITHFEARPEVEALGAGLLLQPRGLASLARLGGLEAAHALGARIDRFSAHDQKHRCLMDVSYAEIGATAGALGLQRRALQSVLIALDEGAASVNTSTAITQLDAQSGALWSEGRALGAFDLIIAADGAASVVRSLCPSGLVSRNALYATSALVALVDDLTAPHASALTQNFAGTRHVSAWPVGSAAGEATRKIAIAVNLFDTDSLGEDAAFWWRTQIAAVAPALQRFDLKCTTQAPLHYHYRDVELTRHVHHKVVFLGDAAHAMSPQLGLGASLALCDALAFADALSATPSLNVALENFDRTQRTQLAPLQQLSRRATPAFQANEPLLAALRDRTLAAMRATNVSQASFFKFVL